MCLVIMSQSPLKPSVVLHILAGILQVTSDCKGSYRHYFYTNAVAKNVKYQTC